MARDRTVNTVLDTCTVKEAAELIGVSEQTTRRKMKRKCFKYLKPDNQIQVIKWSLLEWWRSTGSGLQRGFIHKAEMGF